MDIFSACPAGDRIHYWAQRKITRSLPRGDQEFLVKFAHAKRHLEAMKRYGGCAIPEAQFYEFGAGWDLAIALCLSALGVRNQLLIDVAQLAEADLINDTLRKLSEVWARSGSGPIEIQTLGSRDKDTWLQILQYHYGICYLAPRDARATGLPSESVDCITSTDTLEHIPEEDICLILRECRRLLRKDGILSFAIDYRDHYSYGDPRITPYNFLQYPPTAWKVFNPRLYFQNRLRHKDYIRLAAMHGFELLEEQREEVLEKDFADLHSVNINRAFGGYGPEELAVRRGHLAFGLAPH